MAKHEHGTVDVSANEQNLGRFVKTVGWAIVVILGFLVFVALVNG